jgi:hypothetical protein
VAAPISDAVVVDVLRRVDRVLAPLVQRLGRPPELPLAERADWWDRDLPAEAVRPLLQRPRGVYVDEALGARRSGTVGVVRSLWRVTRLLSRIDDALDARPKGRLHHRAFAQLPVIGVAGGYAAEREALRRAARRAAELLSAPAR